MEQFVVSARKYRPQTFKDVVGQSTITNTLLNAIETNHLAQALLFTGPRGVGKTTCARILARKINQPGYDDPEEDFAFNVFELDAASNNSVDDIRSLIDQVRIPPQTGKYKVYIIDEVHMLSSAAFNAFLKTLEEPPKHAIFILATTEKHKIIPTILSRCQIFDFKRITVKDAKEHLAEVADSQGVIYEEDALHIIAQKADGAMRDALSIFDRVVSFCGKNLTRQAVTENLNVLDYETYLNVTDLILENKIPDLLISYNEVLSKGFDGHHFISGLASHFRDLLVSQTPATIGLIEAGEQTKRAYFEQSKKASAEFLLQGIAMANDCDMKFKVSQNQRLLVELCLMQLASITFDGEKKKVDGFIIPAKNFYKRVLNREVDSPQIVSEGIPSELNPSNNVAPTTNPISEIAPKPAVPTPVPSAAVAPTPATDFSKQPSAFSISSIKAKKELEKSFKPVVHNVEHLPALEFTEIDLRVLWGKYAQRLSDKGYKIMEALLLINDPKVDGHNITYELPNQGSKIDFESEKGKLVSYLRGHLQNHNINIEVIVNEEMTVRKAYTDQDRYNRLHEINPDIELLKNTFGLYF